MHRASIQLQPCVPLVHLFTLHLLASFNSSSRTRCGYGGAKCRARSTLAQHSILPLAPMTQLYKMQLWQFGKERKKDILSFRCKGLLDVRIYANTKSSPERNTSGSHPHSSQHLRCQTPHSSWEQRTESQAVSWRKTHIHLQRPKESRKDSKWKVHTGLDYNIN